ncbi:unnamed protein product, partial [Discosporangium mesarthrocarpum]
KSCVGRVARCARYALCKRFSFVEPTATRFPVPSLLSSAIVAHIRQNTQRSVAERLPCAAESQANVYGVEHCRSVGVPSPLSCQLSTRWSPMARKPEPRGGQRMRLRLRRSTAERGRGLGWVPGQSPRMKNRIL